MIHRHAALSLAILLAAGGLNACRRKMEPAPAPASVPTSDNSAQLAAAAAQRRADSLAAARSALSPADAQRVQAEMAQTLAQRIYFDYDKDQLRDDARASLDEKAAILVANSGVALVITGHTDERGTAEYNLALGQRRSAQVKRYLESKGVAESRLSTQSLGDSQPASQGTDEPAYQQNRRAEFEARNAGALVRPRS